MNITSRWLAPDGDPSRGVDGFRLDACENVPRPFWVDWRKEVKSIKPDAYVTGEIWSIAPHWLDGQTFDATMQYPFAEAMESFFVDQKTGIPPSVFAAPRLQQLTIVYPFQVSLVQMNLLDSHDTDRWASRFVNPDLAFNAKSRIEDNNPNYNVSKPGDAEVDADETVAGRADDATSALMIVRRRGRHVGAERSVRSRTDDLERFGSRTMIRRYFSWRTFSTNTSG